jgi:hypothetical protein
MSKMSLPKSPCVPAAEYSRLDALVLISMM